MGQVLFAPALAGCTSDDVTASAAQVLSGYTALTKDSNDDPISGTMANRGAWTSGSSGSGHIAIPAGYHNGSGYVDCSGAYNAGVTAADARVNTSSANYKAGYNAGKASITSKSINVTIPYQGEYGRAATTKYNVGHTIVAAGVKDVRFGGSHYDPTSGANGWHSSAYVGCTYSGTTFTVNCKTGTHAVGADHGEGYGADASGNITCTVSVAYYT